MGFTTFLSEAIQVMKFASVRESIRNGFKKVILALPVNSYGSCPKIGLQSYLLTVLVIGKYQWLLGVSMKQS